MTESPGTRVFQLPVQPFPWVVHAESDRHPDNNSWHLYKAADRQSQSCPKTRMSTCTKAPGQKAASSIQKRLKPQDCLASARSEERRVGKECRSRWATKH